MGWLLAGALLLVVSLALTPLPSHTHTHTRARAPTPDLDAFLDSLARAHEAYKHMVYTPMFMASNSKGTALYYLLQWQLQSNSTNKWVLCLPDCVPDQMMMCGWLCTCVAAYHLQWQLQSASTNKWVVGGYTASARVCDCVAVLAVMCMHFGCTCACFPHLISTLAAWPGVTSPPPNSLSLARTTHTHTYTHARPPSSPARLSRGIALKRLGLDEQGRICSSYALRCGRRGRACMRACAHVAATVLSCAPTTHTCIGIDRKGIAGAHPSAFAFRCSVAHTYQNTLPGPSLWKSGCCCSSPVARIRN